jgi:putative ATPase
MRPRILDKFVGQEHLSAKAVRYTALQERHHSLDDPLGSARHRQNHRWPVSSPRTPARIHRFFRGERRLADLRKSPPPMTPKPMLGRRSMRFIDEIHRSKKGQPDAILPHVEDRTIVIIVATTGIRPSR